MSALVIAIFFVFRKPDPLCPVFVRTGKTPSGRAIYAMFI
jgi:hypothetical protein